MSASKEERLKAALAERAEASRAWSEAARKVREIEEERLKAALAERAEASRARDEAARAWVEADQKVRKIEEEPCAILTSPRTAMK